MDIFTILIVTMVSWVYAHFKPYQIMALKNVQLIVSILPQWTWKQL